MKIRYESLVRLIRDIIPNAQFEQDNEGQLIIYTDMYGKGVSGTLLVSSNDDDLDASPK